MLVFMEPDQWSKAWKFAVVRELKTEEDRKQLSLLESSEYRQWILTFRLKHVFVAGVSMVGVSLRYKEVLKGLSTFLQQKKQVAGIGEIGFEPDSSTCSDLKIQEGIIQFQLELAKKLGKVVCFYTPLKEKVKWIERYLAMIKEAHLDQTQVVMDHSDGTNVRTVVNAGC